MTEEITLKERLTKITGYFSKQDWGIIVLLAIVAFATVSYGLKYILPGGSAPGLVHGFLKLPGPGAGIFIGSAFSCIWLVLALLLVRKPGTALTVTILTVIMGGIAALVTGGDMRFSMLAIAVALIIEGIGLLPIEKKPYQYIFPPVIGIMGLITLALWLTGNAKMGENGAASTVFPLGYAVTGIIAVALAVICWFYPMRYLTGAGFAEVFYIAFCWTFNGKTGLFTWVPATPAIPALLTFAMVCGASMAFLAYAVYLLVRTYKGEGPLAQWNH
jgi:hypothetical protein